VFIFEQNPCQRPAGRWVGVVARSALGLTLLIAMAVLPGCDSGGPRVANPEAATKTLIDPNTAPKARPTANKKLGKFVEQHEQEIAKHPKIR